MLFVSLNDYRSLVQPQTMLLTVVDDSRSNSFDRSHALVASNDVRSERVYLVVRRNALLKRADWPRAPEWSAEFYASLKSVARDYSRTERVVGRLLGWRSWRTLSDREFKLVRL